MITLRCTQTAPPQANITLKTNPVLTY